MMTEREFADACRRELGQRTGQPVESLAEKSARLEAEQRRDHGEGECPPGSLYFCPAAGEIESSCHGGFDQCCDRPDAHVPMPDGPGTEAVSAALSEASRREFALREENAYFLDRFNSLETTGLAARMGYRAAKDLHQPMQRAGQTICAHCSGWDGRRCRGVVTPHPCPTLQALDGTGEA